MQTVEERLAYLEGRVEQHGRGMADIGDAVVQFTHRMNGLDQKIDRFCEELAGRIDAVEQRLTGRIDGLGQKLSRQFLWLVGVQVTVLLAVIGAMLRG